MRKQYIVILLVLFAGLNTQAQTNFSAPADSTLHIGLNTYVQRVSFIAINAAPQQEYRHYLKTAKTLKILGWTSLGVGIPTMFFGLLITAVENRDGPSTTNIGVVVLSSGAVLTAASIPLFIVSHHYKKKAVSLSLGSQQVFIPQGNRFVSGVQPALSVKVSL